MQRRGSQTFTKAVCTVFCIGQTMQVFPARSAHSVYACQWCQCRRPGSHCKTCPLSTMTFNNNATVFEFHAAFKNPSYLFVVPSEHIFGLLGQSTTRGADQGCIGRGGRDPRPPPGSPACAQPSEVPASTAFVTDSNRPQPLWQPPPTACLTASGAASEAPSLQMHPWGRSRSLAQQHNLWGPGKQGEKHNRTEASDCDGIRPPLVHSQRPQTYHTHAHGAKVTLNVTLEPTIGARGGGQLDKTNSNRKGARPYPQPERGPSMRRKHPKSPHPTHPPTHPSER